MSNTFPILLFLRLRKEKCNSDTKNYAVHGEGIVND